jgi:thiosulfate reductase cytochrome b subunit
MIPADGYLGLPVLGPIHTLCGYLFVAFLLLHIYISTLEPDARGRLRAMLTGK